MLRDAGEEVEDTINDQQEIDLYRFRFLHRLHGAMETCIACCLEIARILWKGLSRLMQWMRRSSLCRWFRRSSESPVQVTTNIAAAAEEPVPVTIDIAAADEEPVLVTTGAAASDEPDPVTTRAEGSGDEIVPVTSSASNEPVPVTTTAASSDESVLVTASLDSSGWCLSCFCSSFDLLKNWLDHMLELACFYRDWSYDMVGITSCQETATAFDCFVTAISKRNLKKRIEKVERTVSEVKKYLLLDTASKSSPIDIANKNRSRIRTASIRTVFGREALRDNIMAKLRETPPSSGTSPCYSVIGIYGFAGSGKTTFARYIRDYIEKECKEEKLFHTIMCIHLSETFSVADIFHEMLKDITSDRHANISDCEKLEENLKESLSGKRFFLILDDLWVKTKNDPQLEKLISPLNVGMKGSKILVTARTKVAARSLCDDEPIEMPDLDKDLYFSMFMYYALGSTSVADEFIRVGRVIAEKLHQSPIAAVAVAGRLGTNLDIKFWKNTANRGMLKDTMDALWWSYQPLNPDIRRCFEFCNIFPRRSKLRRDELVHLWVAQGFVKSGCATEDMEDVAEGYIQELISCSFLQPEVDDNSKEYFTIHDLLHDLLDKVAGSDCFRIENARSWKRENWKGEVPRDVRHLFVQSYDAELITKKILGLENLRTLIINVVKWDTVREKIIESICKRLPKLRVLAIAFSQECRPIRRDYGLLVPESISLLKHLRYFALRTESSCGVFLPSATTKLHHIQLIDFKDCNNVGSTFTDLISLRHIICWGVTFRNVGKLTSLQTIPDFTVRNIQGYEVKQLRDLNKLRGNLMISGLEYVKSKEEALEANLASKERLTELKLFWRWYEDDTRCSREVQEEVLEGMCPPVGLQTLTISGYEGSRYPDWMVGRQDGAPKDLQKLVFDACGQRGPGPEFEAFIHIRVLCLASCDWDALPENMERLTLLKQLFIEGCHNIRLLPTLPRSLEKFDVCWCNGEFMQSCQTVGHTNWLKIEYVPEKIFELPAPLFSSSEED